MSQLAEKNIPSLDLDASIHFVVHDGRKPQVILPQFGVRGTRRTGTYADSAVTIADARPLAGRLDIEREGFVLARHDTAVADFYDDDAVKRVYYPEIEALVKEVTGARRVVMFDHTVRAADENTQSDHGVREPVHIAHNDYTEASAPQRVRDLLPEEADDLLSRRFAVVQVWRPIDKPVEQQPLAICDAQSLGPDDLVETDLVYDDRMGEILQVAHSPGQRWYYFPRMTRDEAMVFKCYDSLKDGRARFTAHSAFHDPTTIPGAPERVSIEARTLVFF